MKIKLDKMKFNSIETAFTVLKQDPNNKASLVIISKALKDCFGSDFFVTVVEPKFPNSPLFIMSVYPQYSTISKIVDALGSDKEVEAISKLWDENNKWTIEIDKRILYSQDDGILGKAPTEKELTAALLHEVGHIVYSNSIPSKISIIMRYELAKSPLVTKVMLKDKVFKPLMALPVLDSCSAGASVNKKALKEEIKADTFAKKMGYSNDLSSFLDKVIKYSEANKKINTADDSMRKVTQYVVDNLSDFSVRKDALSKSNLLSLKESCDSPYINELLDNYIEKVYEDSNISRSIVNGRNLEIMHERVEAGLDEYYKEFTIFPTKKLKRIDPAELDYILVKISEIRNDSDKMMLISYIYNKIDVIDYYLSILSDPALSRKYSVPHNVSQLKAMKARLNEYREKILNYHIPERDKHILVKWPTGYEG